MFKKDSFTDGRLVVNSLAAVSIAAGPNFIEKGTVDLIHFCTIDFGKSFRHCFVINYKRSFAT